MCLAITLYLSRNRLSLFFVHFFTVLIYSYVDNVLKPHIDDWPRLAILPQGAALSWPYAVYLTLTLNQQYLVTSYQLYPKKSILKRKIIYDGCFDSYFSRFALSSLPKSYQFFIKNLIFALRFCGIYGKIVEEVFLHHSIKPKGALFNESKEI